MNSTDILIIISLIILFSYLITTYKLYRPLDKLNYKKETNQPNVSVVVSLHNEERNVSDLIKYLVAQEYPVDKFEIILVNDRSTDTTQQLLENAANNHANIQIIKIDDLQENFAPKKFAIDSAIKYAKGDIILLTDADGRPEKKWIKSILACFSDETGLVLGNAPYVANTLMQKMLAMEYFSHATVAAATTGMNYPLTCVGTNMAYRKELYKDIDGFGEFKNIHTGDDDLFLQRIRENSNWEIRYAVAEDSQVKNAAPDSFKQFMNQRLRYASKGFKYPVKVSIALVIYYLFNVLLILIAGLIPVENYIAIPFLMILFFKALADFLLMKKSAKVLNLKIYFWLFPVVNILHITYVVFFGLMGNIKKFEWAGINH